MKKGWILLILMGFAACDLIPRVKEVYPGFIYREELLHGIGEQEPHTGEVRDWFEDGSLKLEAHYEEGVRQEITFYFRNGNRQAHHLRTENGWAVTSWYENGQIQEEFFPFHVRQWFENGQMKAEVGMDEDQEYHGAMRVWDQEGNLIAHEVYEHGELTETLVPQE
ncbi:MAG: hypothetical protein WDZ29_02165 [Balneolaceae bacterium]